MQKRKASRRHQRADLNVYVNKIIGDEPHLARVRDISTGGVYLYKLLEPFAESNGQVGLEIQLPTSKEIIWAVGKVVREEECNLAEGCALQFTRIAESDRELIRDYVRTLEQPRAA